MRVVIIARSPISYSGVRKAAIEGDLFDGARRHRFPATVLHAGRLAGTATRRPISI